VTRLVASGAIAIAVFASIGQLSHRGGVSFGGYAGDLVPLLACWALVAWWTRRFLPTWLVGVTAGVAVRMVVLSHYRWGELAFLAVALAFVGAVAFAAWWGWPRLAPGTHS
jgi:hypothetical protein